MFLGSMDVPGRKKNNLYVEVAKDDESRALGLMYRKRLASNRGMLFCFPGDSRYSFWMKDTYIPLDIGFIDSSGKLLEVRSMIPMSTRSVRSSKKCRYALEVNRGWFENNGIKPGMQIIRSNMKTAQTDSGDQQPQNESPVAVFWSFEKSVEVAEKLGYDIIIRYRPGKESQKRRKRELERQVEENPFGIGFSGPGEQGGYVDDYHLVIGLGKTENLPGSIRPYEISEGRNGKKITALVKRTGRPQSFTLDNILDYNFLTPEGVKSPEEFNIEDLVNAMENVYEPLIREPQRATEQEREEPESEENPLDDRSIPFWDGMIPSKEEKSEWGKHRNVFETQDKEKNVRRKPDSYRNMWDFLNKSESDHRDMVKKSQAGGGSSDSENMMIEYWESLSKKRKKGLSEGQAILEYLKENEESQKQERGG